MTHVHIDPEVHVRAHGDGKTVSEFLFTLYYLAKEPQPDPDSEFVTLYTRTCEPLAEVTAKFAAAAAMQGTGRLRDGRLVNFAGRCDCGYSPCFRKGRGPWGRTSSGLNVRPFRTVATDPAVVPAGTWLYVPALAGKHVPGAAPWGNFIHDGCLLAADTGEGIRGHQIDFHVAASNNMRHFRWLARRPVRVEVGSSHCAHHMPPETVASLPVHNDDHGVVAFR